MPSKKFTNSLSHKANMSLVVGDYTACIPMLPRSHYLSARNLDAFLTNDIWHGQGISRKRIGFDPEAYCPKTVVRIQNLLYTNCRRYTFSIHLWYESDERNHPIV
jgi:tRNA U34 5-methylaminomethyl-2-thiouridine-forming methyltransferase MnmC